MFKMKQIGTRGNGKDKMNKAKSPDNLHNAQMNQVRRTRLDLIKVAEQPDIPLSLLAAVRQAIQRGFTVADLVANLTDRGYEMVLVPQGSEVGIPLPLSPQEKSANVVKTVSMSKAMPADVRAGTAVLYAVPKPNEPTTYAHGIVERITREGAVQISGTNETVEAEANDPVATVRVYVKRGDKYMRTDRQVAKPVSQLRIIDDFLEKVLKASAVETRLRELAREHNEQHGSDPDKSTDYRTLQAVFDRGIGAYRTNPSSVRPTVTSAQQWAYARVNGFLYALRTGRFRRGAFDTDLLPKGHPRSTKGDK